MISPPGQVPAAIRKGRSHPKSSAESPDPDRRISLRPSPFKGNIQQEAGWAIIARALGVGK
jgi:hypothetical protein